ncbi:MAG: hypothetical protein JWM14_2432 [Chitinophagaceae bacterium]|nr:hypothetical protein [Chitinophagaceae bacterium]
MLCIPSLKKVSKNPFLYFLVIHFITVLSVVAQNISFERSKNNPIISDKLIAGTEGENINGPSLIKAPEWLPHKLGKYYLYFAHHKGKHIRLAYADDVNGPWKIYEPGSLQLHDCKTCEYGLPNSGQSVKHQGAESGDDAVTHIASPDVHVDEINKQLVMYFHCPIVDATHKGQYTLRATSKDGIHFKADSTILGYSYFRVFKWKDYYYSISRAGLFARSKDGIAAFEEGPNPFSSIQTKENYLRHPAVALKGDTLWVFYSRIGDTPERILLSYIPLTNDWNNWKPTAPVTIAEPQTKDEGVDQPLTKSSPGLYYGKVRELRDPAVFVENDKWYVLYSISGESGISIGELKIK